MDGTLALIWLITSFTDMTLNDCSSACLGEQNAQSRISLQIAELQFNERSVGHEIYAGYDLNRRYGPFQPTIGASVTNRGDTWVGAGFKWTSQSILPGPFFIETSLLPGIFAHGGGPKIGGALQFRSALGAGYEFDNGSTLTVSYDHRSNADTQRLNPGLETLSIRYAFAWD